MRGCSVCEGERWLCQRHPEKAYNASGCRCAVGLPCPACNVVSPSVSYSLRRHLVRPGDRMHAPYSQFVLVADALGLAAILVLKAEVPSLGDYITMECKQFPVTVKLPAFGPTKTVWDGRKMLNVEVCVEAFEPSLPGLATTSSGYREVIRNFISPVFVTFFERHVDWLEDTYGSDRKTWPMLLQFTCCIRNFIVHNDGKVDFKNPNAPAVSWHTLTYGPADQDRQVIGSEVTAADLLVLMFEVSDELDRLGCP